ncbi:MAG: hypothetical protein ACLP1X_27900 [Polyangiaceae bacterium]
MRTDYDASRLVNIGDNRWRVQLQVAVGQRFLKALTLDLIGNVGDISPTFYLGASYHVAAVGQRNLVAPGGASITRFIGARISHAVFL